MRSPRFAITAAAAFGIATLAIAAAPADADVINYTGKIVDYDVTTSGLYDITALGANGGYNFTNGDTGGVGAEIGGELDLSAGETLEVLVGGGGYPGIGGGGSFVVETAGQTFTPLVIAGGGGGPGSSDGGNALTGTAGESGLGSYAGAGGTNGSGAGGGQVGGGGGGFISNGDGGSLGGISFENGGRSLAFDGGFGGGGGNGGGGYSGGGGGGFGNGGFDGGGGGGSFLAIDALDPVLTADANTGSGVDGDGANGSVTIKSIPATTSVPEPGTLGVFAAALAMLGFGVRRSRGRPIR